MDACRTHLAADVGQQVPDARFGDALFFIDLHGLPETYQYATAISDYKVVLRHHLIVQDYSPCQGEFVSVHPQLFEGIDQQTIGDLEIQHWDCIRDAE